MKFTVTLVEGDRLILSTEEAVDYEEYKKITDAFQRWRESESGVLVLAQAVVHDRRQVVVDLELEVLPALPAASEAEVRHERLLLDPYERLRAAQADPSNCPNCGEPLATHVECGEFG